MRGPAEDLVRRVLSDGLLPHTEPLELTARLERPEQAAAVLMALTEARIEVAQFSVGSPSLDEVFLALTGRPADPAAEESTS